MSSGHNSVVVKTMDEKRNNTLLLVMAGLILYFSWNNFSTVRNLENRLNSLQGEMGSIRAQLSHEVGHISSVVQQMREDERWWNFRGVQIMDSRPETALVRVEWQLNDYSEGSQVTFHYRKIGEQLFASVDAETVSNGFYYADFPVEVKLEPTWEYHASSSESNRTTRNVTAIEGKGGYDRPSYEYYIAVKQDERILTGEIRNLGLGQLTPNYFSHLSLNVNLDRSNIHVALYETKYDQETMFTVQEAYVELRKGNTVVERQRLSVDAASAEETRRYEIWEHAYEATLTPSGIYDSLFIILKYNEDLTIERQFDINFR